MENKKDICIWGELVLDVPRNQFDREYRGKGKLLVVVYYSKLDKLKMKFEYDLYSELPLLEIAKQKIEQHFLRITGM